MEVQASDLIVITVSESGCGKYAEELVSSWCDQLKVLLKITKTEPQTAYAAFASGFKHKLTSYIAQQCPTSSNT